VNALTTPNSLISYGFYDERFNFCAPEKPEKDSSSLGSVVFGDRVYSSSFKLFMLQNTTCNVLCPSKYLSGPNVKFMTERIQEKYDFNW